MRKMMELYNLVMVVSIFLLIAGLKYRLNAVLMTLSRKNAKNLCLIIVLKALAGFGMTIFINKNYCLI